MGFLRRLFGGNRGHLTSEQMDAITDHIERHLGPGPMIFHELVSDELHLDLVIIDEVRDLGCKAVCTMGMSGLPMRGLPPERRFAELLVLLPKDWPTEMGALEDEANYWPLRWLKNMARLPKDMNCGIGPGISVPNGDPAEELPGTRFTCAMLVPPILTPLDFRFMESEGNRVNFIQLVPLTRAEMEWKMVQVEPLALMDKLLPHTDRYEEFMIVNRNRAELTDTLTD